MSSGWFDCTEPCLTTSLQRKQGCLSTSSGWFKCIEPPQTSSNLLEPHHCRDSKVCRVLSHEFGWFDCTELSLTASLQGKLQKKDT